MWGKLPACRVFSGNRQAGSLPHGIFSQPRPGVQGYQVQAEIGRGRFGAVYRATREADGYPVAMKLVMPRVAVAEDDCHAVLIAVNRTRRLLHPHISPLLECGLDGRTLYFVTEYCDGGNLRGLLAQRGRPLFWEEARPLLLPCLDALAYAHGCDVIHRGINPQNVLLSRQDGRAIARLADFAVGHNLETAGFGGLMATGDYHVDYHFLPREQVTDFRTSSAASDLWSLAATFYYALSGQFPYDFRGRDPIEVILHDAPRPIRVSNPMLPQPVAEVIDRALTGDPLQRFRTAAEMKESWERADLTAAGHLR
jgi:serine/threonine protein kinase